MKRKIVTVLIALMLTVALTACEKGGAADSQQEQLQGQTAESAEEKSQYQSIDEEGSVCADSSEAEESTSADASDVSVPDIESEEESAAESSEETPQDTVTEYGFVLVTDVVPDAVLEIRYYSTFNFVGERIDSYDAPVAYLTKEAAEALKVTSDALMAQGYRIKIYDAYRPQSAVDHFKRWAADPHATEMQAYFYPQLDKSVLFSQGYISARSGHSRGSTVDLTVIDMKTGRELDMGSGFDFFGSVSRPDYTDLSEEQIANRKLLRDAMIAAGFRPISEEWWHFTLENEPYPDTYFDFPITMP